MDLDMVTRVTRVTRVTGLLNRQYMAKVTIDFMETTERCLFLEVYEKPTMR